MSDLDLLLGKWIVELKGGHPRGWTWEYEFHRDKRVTWRDLNSAEKGSGWWNTSSKLVNMGWKDSKTRESWKRPLMPTPTLDKTWYESSYVQGNYKIQK